MQPVNHRQKCILFHSRFQILRNKRVFPFWGQRKKFRMVSKYLGGFCKRWASFKDQFLTKLHKKCMTIKEKLTSWAEIMFLILRNKRVFPFWGQRKKFRMVSKYLGGFCKRWASFKDQFLTKLHKKCMTIKEKLTSWAEIMFLILVTSYFILLNHS